MHFLEPLLKRQADPPRLYLHGSDTPLATMLETAFDSAARRRGLLGHERMPDGTALVIAPCSGIHTFGMRFPIDVIFAARDGQVLKVRSSLPPGRLSLALRAFAVIELAGGALAPGTLRIGDRLVIR